MISKTYSYAVSRQGCTLNFNQPKSSLGVTVFRGFVRFPLVFNSNSPQVFIYAVNPMTLEMKDVKIR